MTNHHVFARALEARHSVADFDFELDVKGRERDTFHFAFDPDRQAVLPVAGDKAGSWTKWYDDNIPLAERRFAAWLSGDYSEERGA